jgi:hypothetical protein
MERLTRRNLLGAASAFAGGTLLAGTAAARTVVSTTGTDPVLVLAERYWALLAEAKPIFDVYGRMRPDDPREKECAAAESAAWGRIGAVVDEVSKMIARTPEGIAEQLGVVRDHDITLSEEADAVLENAIAALRALSAGGAA